MHKFCKEIFANFLQTTRQRKFAHFYYITGFCQKNFNFCKFADSKSGAQELSNDLSNMGFILIRKKSLGEDLIFLAYSAWIGMIFLIGKNAFLKTCSAN